MEWIEFSIHQATFLTDPTPQICHKTSEPSCVHSMGTGPFRTDILRAWNESLWLCDVMNVSLLAGSTWVNEIIFMIANDADIEKACSTPLEQKLVFMEATHSGHHTLKQLNAATAAPRLIKTHVPWRYLQRNADKREKGPKIVVPTHNPKDTLVSSYHFQNNRPNLENKGTVAHSHISKMIYIVNPRFHTS